ncbi:MAG: PD-(D/E)XK nuclease family protein [Patescibacteria group bacterium]
MPNGKRSRNIYDPKSEKPFKFSRSKLELFLQCPRCFYLDRRLGVNRVSGPPFTLNTATDTLLKKEFDWHRGNGTQHSLMKEFEIDAVPFSHPEIDVWRQNFKGVEYLHPNTNLLIHGAVDDIWQSPDGKLHVVDYKSTSTLKEITLEDKWKQAYKRQIEIYQWLLRHNGFDVSDTGYFLYVNADTSREHFSGELKFKLQIIEYSGHDDWVEDAIVGAHECLTSDHVPGRAKECEWCDYASALRDALA